MIVVADASVLVAELMRPRGRALIRHPAMNVFVTEEQLSETRHELERRMSIIVERGHLTTDWAEQTWQDIQAHFDDNAVKVVSRLEYGHLEAMARRRIPRDPNDWPTVALAIALDAGILTNDYDFLGCGCPTWTVETLRGELEDR
jgi:predicted nucleic acid-binding protein